MAYHLIIAKDISSTDTELFFDHYLGSARSIACYWESVGEKLQLPIISSLTRKADSESGFILVDQQLKMFKDEVEILKKYWIDNQSSLPDDFMRDIDRILVAINAAIENNLILMVA